MTEENPEEEYSEPYRIRSWKGIGILGLGILMLVLAVLIRVGGVFAYYIFPASLIMMIVGDLTGIRVYQHYWDHIAGNCSNVGIYSYNLSYIDDYYYCLGGNQAKRLACFGRGFMF